MAKAPNVAATEAPPAEAGSTKSAPRKIPGSMPYLTASGSLKKVLDKIIEAQQPPRFSVDFLETVLSLTGGGARATIPILKKMGFVASDGTPTNLYSKFRTNSGRAAAALQGLQNAFSEIFKKNSYAHTATDSKLKDIILEITGLTSSDPVVTAIKGTFNVIKSYIPSGTVLEESSSDSTPEDVSDQDRAPPPPSPQLSGDEGGRIRLAYNINIVLPETSDLNVLNAIFRSIKENLMK